MSLFDGDKGTVIMKFMSAQRNSSHLQCIRLKRYISHFSLLPVSYSDASAIFNLI